MPHRLRRPWVSVFTAKHRKISQKGEAGVLPGGFASTDNKLYSAFLGLCTHGSPAWTDLALLARDTAELGENGQMTVGRRGVGRRSLLVLSKFCD